LGIAVANGGGTACLETTLPSNITGEYVIIATGVGKTDLLTTEATIVSQSGNDITVCGYGFAPGSDVRFFVKTTGSTDTTTPVGSGTAGGSNPSSGSLVHTGADGSLLAQQVGVGCGPSCWASAPSRGPAAARPLRSSSGGQGPEFHRIGGQPEVGVMMVPRAKVPPTGASSG
jgi:hypothetical protein